MAARRWLAIAALGPLLLVVVFGALALRRRAQRRHGW